MKPPKNSENYINGRLGSIRVVRLFIQMTAYYLLFFGLLFGSIYLFPSVREFLPFGYTARVAPITNDTSLQDLTSYTYLSDSAVKNSIKLFSAILGVTLVMLPVTWMYLKSRVIKKLDQSLVQTMLLLPIAVAGVVSIVQHSIALAFSSGRHRSRRSLQEHPEEYGRFVIHFYHHRRRFGCRRTRPRNRVGRDHGLQFHFSPPLGFGLWRRPRGKVYAAQ